MSKDNKFSLDFASTFPRFKQALGSHLKITYIIHEKHSSSESKTGVTLPRGSYASLMWIIFILPL